MSCAALTILVIFAALYGTAVHIVSFSIFGSTMILLYLSSTLYHSVSRPGAKKVFRIIDHSAIYLLIAGTYTPLMLSSIRGALGWSIFGVIWGLAIVGIVMKCCFISKFQTLSVIIYILMGWCCILFFRELFYHVSLTSLIFLLAGGVVYTAGVIFYSWRSLPYNHAIWHLFVMGGSTLHFFSILYTL